MGVDFKILAAMFVDCFTESFNNLGVLLKLSKDSCANKTRLNQDNYQLIMIYSIAF